MIERINHIISHFQISPSKLADEIGVQRANISHLLSGRNKPSLDLIQKILTRWNQINPEWLLLGRGDFLLGKTNESNNDSSENNKIPKTENVSTQKNVTPAVCLSNPKSISKIVVFFSDGTFEEYLH